MRELFILALRFGGGLAILASLTILAGALVAILPRLDRRSFRSTRERRQARRVLSHISSGAAVTIIVGAIFIYWSFQ